MARAIDADEIMREAEHISTFRCNLAGLSDLAILLSGANTIDPVKQGWISVKDGLPEIDQKVLVYDAGDETEIHVYHLREDLDGLYWDDEGGWAVDFENVTHWMPLPEPPKEGE